MTQECYVSVDIEADGPIPGSNSMISIGAAAFDAEGTLVTTYAANLVPLADAEQDAQTMQWWRQHLEAWEWTTRDPRPPNEVMTEFADWASGLPGRPVFVGYPASYDFMWVYWYLIRFTGASPFGFAALDIKTLAMALTGRRYRSLSRSFLAERWRVPHRETHQALEDALDQGRIFARMLHDLKDGSGPGPA